jgi:hypothetical protein
MQAKYVCYENPVPAELFWPFDAAATFLLQTRETAPATYIDSGPFILSVHILYGT